VLIIIALIILLVLPSPWNVIVFAITFVLGIGEIAYWNRTVKGRAVRAGSETLIGSNGVAISDCRPDGQIKIDGAIWDAHCGAGAGAGQSVRVIARTDLVLEVEPLSPAAESS
jgi:membrane protein implicated in regulation of membrane protease activity